MNTEQRVDKPEVLTLRRVAIILDCSKAYVRKLVYDGALPAFHRGGTLVIKRKDVTKLIKNLKPVKID